MLFRDSYSKSQSHPKKKNHIPTLTFKNINIFLKHSQTNHTFNKSAQAWRFRNLMFRQHAEETTKGKLTLVVSFSDIPWEKLSNLTNN